jgi:hypothetical protein
MTRELSGTPEFIWSLPHLLAGDETAPARVAALLARLPPSERDSAGRRPNG